MIQDIIQIAARGNAAALCSKIETVEQQLHCKYSEQKQKKRLDETLINESVRYSMSTTVC